MAHGQNSTLQGIGKLGGPKQTLELGFADPIAHRVLQLAIITEIYLEKMKSLTRRTHAPEWFQNLQMPLLATSFQQTTTKTRSIHVIVRQAANTKIALDLRPRPREALDARGALSRN